MQRFLKNTRKTILTYKYVYGTFSKYINKTETRQKQK